MRARRVFGKLPPQPVECNDGSTTTGSRRRCVRGFGDGGWNGWPRDAVRWWRRDDEKKETAPFPRFGVWGAPSMCVCVCVFLSCVVSVVHVWRERTRDSLFFFFFTSLFSLSPPPQSPHPYDTRRRWRRWTPALSSLFLVAVHKRDAPAVFTDVGEKNLHEMTHIFLLIFSFPLVAVIHHFSVFDFYSFPNVGRDRVAVFPTKPNHHIVRSVIHHACRWPTL